MITEDKRVCAAVYNMPNVSRCEVCGDPAWFETEVLQRAPQMMCVCEICKFYKQEYCKVGIITK
jgi:hypothetical protein